MRMTIVSALVISQVAGLALNYLADVLPRTRALSRAAWWPLSLASLRAYFANLRVWLVQVLALATAYWLWGEAVPGWGATSLAIIFFYFGLVMVIDIEHRAILHLVSVVGTIIFAIIGSDVHGLANTLLGGVAGFGVLLAIYWLGDQMTKWLAQRKGEPLDERALGFGDVILAGVIGLLLGWPGVLGGLILGVFLAGVYSALHILWQLARREYRMFASIPLGPFLSLGALGLLLLRAYFAG